MRLILAGTILFCFLKAFNAYALELSELEKATLSARQDISDTESRLNIVTETPREPRTPDQSAERPENAIHDVIGDESQIAESD